MTDRLVDLLQVVLGLLCAVRCRHCPRQLDAHDVNKLDRIPPTCPQPSENGRLPLFIRCDSQRIIIKLFRREIHYSFVLNKHCKAAFQSRGTVPAVDSSEKNGKKTTYRDIVGIDPNK